MPSSRTEPLVDNHRIQFIRMSLLWWLQMPNHVLGALSRRCNKLVHHFLMLRVYWLKLTTDLAVVEVDNISALFFLLELFGQIVLIEFEREWKVHVVIKFFFVRIEAFHLDYQDSWDLYMWSRKVNLRVLILKWIWDRFCLPHYSQVRVFSASSCCVLK